ncbi:MAG: hypothetical protein ACLPPF_21865 [Rhodomicrobium sp.]
MVKAELRIYLTDFLDAAFAAKNAKNRDFRGGKKLRTAAVYHAGINHDVALRNCQSGDVILAPLLDHHVIPEPACGYPGSCYEPKPGMLRDPG